MPPSQERRALEDLTAWLHARFGERLSELMLFGSRARGDGAEDSDLDVLVVVDGLTTAEAGEIADQAGDQLTRYAVLQAPFTVSAERMAHLRRRERRIAREIDSDGLPL